MVCQVFERYTEQGWSLKAIARGLNEQGVPTRKKARWEGSTIWYMLRNPAYEGKACFGKTERVARRKVTRRLRQRGGFSPRVSAPRGPGAWLKPLPEKPAEAGSSSRLPAHPALKNRSLTLRARLLKRPL